MDAYIRIYWKEWLYLAFLCSLIECIPLLIVALLYDVIPYDLLIAFCPFLIAVALLPLAWLSTWRFRRMIAKQEALYGIAFSDTGVVCLDKMLHLSDAWLIVPGRCAIYKHHIRSVKCVRSGRDHKLDITTTDNRCYRVWCRSSTVGKTVQKWSRS